MRARSEERALALQALYCMAMHTEEREEEGLVADAVWRVNTEEREEGFALLIINGVQEHLAQVNQIISNHALHWQFNRLLEVDKAILRLSVYSLLYLTDIPVAVTINEAIELAKRYSDTHSPQFVNGVLDACAKEFDRATS